MFRHTPCLKSVHRRFPSVAGHFMKSSNNSNSNNVSGSDYDSFSSSIQQPKIIPDDEESFPLKKYDENRTGGKRHHGNRHNMKKSSSFVDVALLEEEDNNNNNNDNSTSQFGTRSDQHQNTEMSSSRFSDVLSERMRELNSEKHRDFQLSTHLASRGIADKEEQEAKRRKNFSSTTMLLEETNNKNKNQKRNKQNNLDSSSASEEETLFIQEFLDDCDDFSVSNSSSSGSSGRNNILSSKPISVSSSVNESDENLLNDDEKSSSSTTANNRKNETFFLESDIPKEVSLHRAVARAGFCSRRASIDLISSGKIKVDGVQIWNPFQKIRASNDIHVEGHRGRLRFAAPRLFSFHKPAHVLVAHAPLQSNDLSQRTVWTRYAQMLGFDHLIPVGSMPMRSHGLLMLTNDGDLAQWLEHPSTRVQQTYIYRVSPPIDHTLAMRLNTNGVNIDGVIRREFEFHTFPLRRSRNAIRIKVQQQQESSNTNSSSSQSSRYKNNNNNNNKSSSSSSNNNNNNKKSKSTTTMPVVQMLQALQRQVVRGGRVSFGPFSLKGLAPGGIREVAVPPFYLKYFNPVWHEFIERDWSYYRRLRIQRLMRLSRWRHLSDRELEEVEQMSAEELNRTFTNSGDDNDNELKNTSSEVEQEAKLFADSLITEPNVNEMDFKFSAEDFDNENNNNNGGGDIRVF